MSALHELKDRLNNVPLLEGVDVNYVMGYANPGFHMSKPDYEQFVKDNDGILRWLPEKPDWARVLYMSFQVASNSELVERSENLINDLEQLKDTGSFHAFTVGSIVDNVTGCGEKKKTITNGFITEEILEAIRDARESLGMPREFENPTEETEHYHEDNKVIRFSFPLSTGENNLFLTTEKINQIVSFFE